MPDEKTPAGKNPATVNAAFDRLESAALRIYEGLLIVHPQREQTALAEEAFARAAPFAAMAESVRDAYVAGKPLPARSIGVYTAPPMVEVEVYAYNPETNDYEVVIDEKTDKPKKETVPGDPDAFYPNMAETHPLNQRHVLARKAQNRLPEWEERPFDKLTGRGVRAPRAYKHAVN